MALPIVQRGHRQNQTLLLVYPLYLTSILPQKEIENKSQAEAIRYEREGLRTPHDLKRSQDPLVLRVCQSPSPAIEYFTSISINAFVKIFQTFFRVCHYFTKREQVLQPAPLIFICYRFPTAAVIKGCVKSLLCWTA